MPGFDYYQKQTEEFLQKWGFKIEKRLVGSEPFMMEREGWDGDNFTYSKEHIGDHNKYKIILTANDGRQFDFEFYDSVYNTKNELPLDNYSIISSLSGDAQFTTRQDCIDCGYREEEHASVIDEILAHSAKIREFFSKEELEDLGKIQ